MTPKPTDIRVIGAELYFLPIQTRVPLKFGNETLTHVTCARVRVLVETRNGTRAEGWGETPLSVQWVWPSAIAYEERHDALMRMCGSIAKAWAAYEEYGHPMTIGVAFQEGPLRELVREYNATHAHAMPWLAALVCCSAFDIAVHDAYGNALNLPVYATYNADFMNRSLGAFLEGDGPVSFTGRYPQDYFADVDAPCLPAWHLVGGKDPIDATELDGSEPNDGYPVLLQDWILRDGLTCLKVKLRGNDAAWDYARLTGVGKIAGECGAQWLSADFNCTVTDVSYVNEILDRLKSDAPRVFDMLLYVEQPFPYEIEEHRIDVHSVSLRKPLFMDESAHDWRLVRLGRELGWTGVALKTCKTQTGALLSLCWAKAHGMALMVQDLTNPMLAQIPHVLLAAHAGTIMGVETNAMQFYPDASAAEAKVHPGLYVRRDGRVDFSTVSGPGFGYRLDRIERELPAPAVAV
ncbi:MAG: mandelate racemase/muconate lactonizing enzyme family protein [Candidatus Hydrogenedentes bacterium]|nr:mandelate racemase/muconate lactonizing enzyme family protein [Candidatus Hydrogenedentota bacterium]